LSRVGFGLGRLAFLALGLLGVAPACLPRSFDALEQAALVTTIRARLSDEGAVVRWALTVDADDEGRGRVLYGDGEAWLAWLRLDERGEVELETMLPFEREALTDSEDPTFTGLALVPARDIPEALLRVESDAERDDRIVRMRVADFSRVDAPIVTPSWIVDVHADADSLAGVLGAVELDGGQPELFSGTQDGALLIWPELGSSLDAIAAAREQALLDDPSAFEADPSLGFGLTRCEGLGSASAITGGAVLADERSAALLLQGDTITMVAALEGGTPSPVGTTPIDCAAGMIELEAAASSLLVVDLERDGDLDLLVGAPASERVFVFESEGAAAGLPDSPSFVIEPEQARGGEFGASLALADLGGELGRVIVVGAPTTMISKRAKVGRVHVFELDGTPLTEFSDLEPQTDSRHGLGVHALGLPGRDELVVTGQFELRVHWSIASGDPRP
jgi:hypothetical protein